MDREMCLVPQVLYIMFTCRLPWFALIEQKKRDKFCKEISLRTDKIGANFFLWYKVLSVELILFWLGILPKRNSYFIGKQEALLKAISAELRFLSVLKQTKVFGKSILKTWVTDHCCLQPPPIVSPPYYLVVLLWESGVWLLTGSGQSSLQNEFWHLIKALVVINCQKSIGWVFCEWVVPGIDNRTLWQYCWKFEKTDQEERMLQT